MKFHLLCTLFMNLIVISAAYGDICSCGTFDKTATSEVKSIHSPNYPGDYCRNLNCIYTITANEGYRILANLSVFDTESTFDYLKFFDGPSTGSSVLISYSGHHSINRPLIKSTSNNLTIQFKTDSSYNYKGFMLQFMAVRDGNQTIEETVEETESQEDCECELQKYSSNETSGEIKSPGYPGTVCNKATYCIYEIEGNPSLELNVVLTLQIKSSYKLTIYQTMQYEGREIQMYWHTYTSTSSRSNQFNFPKNVGARIVLEYDDTVTRITECGWACQLPTKTAFTAVFNRIKKELSCPYPLIDVAKEPKSISYSLGRNSDLPGDNCDLMFITEPNMRIKLQIDKTNNCGAKFTQYENDTRIRRIEFSKTIIYLSTGANDYERSKQYGFESETNEMTIKTLNNDRTCKIDMTYASSETDCKCSDKPRLLFENNTTVTHLSPGFPYSFCPGLQCNDEFTNNLMVNNTSGDVKAFLLTWNDFQIDENVKNDLQLWIKVDNDTWTNIRFKSEGNKHILMGNKMLINFKNINTLGLHGYNVTVEAVVIPKKCLCSNTYLKTLSRNEGSLELLLPGECDLIYCHYETEPSQNSHDELVFTWMNFKLASEGDKLTMKEDEGEHRSFFYNYGREDKKFFSQKNLALSFERDERSKMNRTKMDSKIEIKWKSGESCTCILPDDVATNEVKFIYSPKLSTTILYHIMVNVTEFDTENFNDYLKLYDGNNTEDKLLEKFSGHRLRLPLVNSTSNFLTIRFHSDKDIVEKGFALSYWAEPLSPLNEAALSKLTEKVSSSHLGIISVLLVICTAFGIISTIFGVMLLKKRGSFSFPTTFRNPVFATQSVYYSDDNVSTRSRVTRREEL